MEREKNPEEKLNLFKKGNIITCPSDLTGILWKVTKDELKDGGIEVAVLGGQWYPSDKYPKETMILERHAQKNWKLIKKSSE